MALFCDPIKVDTIDIDRGWHKIMSVKDIWSGGQLNFVVYILRGKYRGSAGSAETNVRKLQWGYRRSCWFDTQVSGQWNNDIKFGLLKRSWIKIFALEKLNGRLAWVHELGIPADALNLEMQHCYLYFLIWSNLVREIDQKYVQWCKCFTLLCLRAMMFVIDFNWSFKNRL